ncbi:MAG: hypothetical protein KDB27_23840 [Planctomycetales bacterium]|nr:hypothetical protein [Planctomycetales bacterium]
MQLSLSDHDVKSHTQILKRLRILLIGLFLGSVALLYSAGAFSPASVAEYEPMPAENSTTSAKANDSDHSQSQASITDQSAANSQISSDKKTNAVDVPQASTVDRALAVHDSHDATESYETMPVAADAETSHKSAFPRTHLLEPLREKEKNAAVSRAGDNSLPPGQLRTVVSFIRSGTKRNVSRVRLPKQVATIAKAIVEFSNRSIDEVAAQSQSVPVVEHASEPSNANSTKDVSLESSQEPLPKAIVIRNGLGSRSAVAFLVGSEVKQLEPGESITINEIAPVIRFHRGADFGNAKITLQPGEYEFQATARGWFLEVVAD